MTRMPAVARKLEHVFARSRAQAANPDEAVAIGAATQCAILDGLLTGVVLLDVTSRAIGVQRAAALRAGDPKNATVPTRESRVIATTQDGQRELVDRGLRGRAASTCAEPPARRFTLWRPARRPAGEVVAMVDFTVDVDGILSVSGARALDRRSGTDVRLGAPPAACRGATVRRPGRGTVRGTLCVLGVRGVRGIAFGAVRGRRRSATKRHALTTRRPAVAVATPGDEPPPGGRA
jgi:molecular chaperone DnaK (HSP70)